MPKTNADKPIPDISECYLLGYIARPHGVRGELRVVLDVQETERYQNIKHVYIKKSGNSKAALLRIEINHISFQPNGQHIFRFKNVDDRNAAENLVGSEIWLPLSQLPPLPEGKFYYFEIIGFNVFDINNPDNGSLGTVSEVMEMPGQDIIRVIHPSGKEILIPIIPGNDIQTDRALKTIAIHIPEGLLSIYLDTQQDDEPRDDPEEETEL